MTIQKEPRIQTGRNKFRGRCMMIGFVVLNIAIIVWSAAVELSNAKQETYPVRWQFLAAALGLFIAAMIAECLKMKVMTQHACGRSDWRTAIRTVLIGRFYDNITPGAIGGQPFQIYYLMKSGYPAGESAAVPLGSFIFTQFSFVLLSVGVLITSGSLVRSGAIGITSWLGTLVCAIFPTSVFLSTLIPNQMLRASGSFIRLFHRLHLIKDPERAYRKSEENVTNYSASLRELMRNKGLCVRMFFLGMVYQVAFYSIPFFVLRAFGGDDIAWYPCLVNVVAITAAIAIVPTPGNAGAAEGSFVHVFKSLPGSCFWPMMAWRFFSYYIFILLGLGLYTNIYLNRRNRKEAEAYGQNWSSIP